MGLRGLEESDPKQHSSIRITNKIPKANAIHGRVGFPQVIPHIPKNIIRTAVDKGFLLLC